MKLVDKNAPSRTPLTEMGCSGYLVAQDPVAEASTGPTP